MVNPEKKPEKQYGLMTAEVLSVALEMGFIIALPIVGLGLIGKRLDAAHHVHVFVYVAIVLALTISVVWLYQRFDSFVRKLKNASKNKDDHAD
jgi:flagellar biogenesis protein FliO